MPDIKPVILVLCTMVTNRTVEEKSKIKHVLQLLTQTTENKRIMGVDSQSKLFTWVDSLYGVHPDMKVHTCGDMPFGYGLVHCKLIKQKLNMKISTEA